jgi:hypothetical protein
MNSASMNTQSNAPSFKNSTPHKTSLVPPIPVTVVGYAEPQIADHVYVDGTLYNNSFSVTGDTNQYIQCSITQQRDSPFLHNSSEYNMAVARFSIPSDFLYRIYQPVNTTTSTTMFLVSLSYNSVYYDTPILIPLVTNAVGESVRFCYNINNFLDLVNAAYATSYAAVTGAGGPTGTGTIGMTYDPATNLYQMNIPTYFGTGTTGTTGNGIGVHMSFLLYQRFQSFNVVQQYPLAYNGHDITFVREYTGNNYINDGSINWGSGITGTYIASKQETAAASSISGFGKLLISSNTLPIYYEYISNITPQTNTTNNSGANILPILTDFLIGDNIPLNNPASPFVYSPTIYRLISMKGSNPLSIWDIKVYFTDPMGNIYPLYLSPGSTFDVKLLFIKRGLSS